MSQDSQGFSRSTCGFDHGVGHPFLLLDDAKTPNCRKIKAFNDFGHYSAWPKVADTVIKAARVLSNDSFLAVTV